MPFVASGSYGELLLQFHTREEIGYSSGIISATPGTRFQTGNLSPEEPLSLTSETDFDLIQACRKGESHAWERILNKFERLVYSIALKYGLSVEDAADVTQTTFTILMQSLDSLREDTRLAPWLATVAKRHTWRCMTKRKREQTTPDDDLAMQAWAVQRPANPFEAWERVEWLRNGLEQLDQRCREILLSLYFEAETPSYVEIAERFEMSPGSVGPTRARCLERLRALMVEAVLV